MLALRLMLAGAAHRQRCNRTDFVLQGHDLPPGKLAPKRVDALALAAEGLGTGQIAMCLFIRESPSSCTSRPWTQSSTSGVAERSC